MLQQRIVLLAEAHVARPLILLAHEQLARLRIGNVLEDIRPVDIGRLAEGLQGEDLLRLQEALTHVPVAEHVLHYAAQMVLATHPDDPSAPERIRRFVSYGASPRAMQSLVRGARVRAALAGRTTVSIDDIRSIALATLRHRVILNFEGAAESFNMDGLLREMIAKIPTPAQVAA